MLCALLLCSLLSVTEVNQFLGFVVVMFELTNCKDIYASDCEAERSAGGSGSRRKEDGGEMKPS